MTERRKPAPLTGDLVGLLLEVALSDPNWHVRDEAIRGLRHQPPDPRAVAAPAPILTTETDPRLRSQAHHALKHQNPTYKAAVDARSREQALAAAGMEPVGGQFGCGNEGGIRLNGNRQ